MWLRVVQTDKPTAENAARPFVDQFLDQSVKNVQLNGTCANSRIEKYEFVSPMTFGETPYFGILFDLTVTEERAVDFEP